MSCWENLDVEKRFEVAQSKPSVPASRMSTDHCFPQTFPSSFTPRPLTVRERAPCVQGQVRAVLLRRPFLHRLYSAQGILIQTFSSQLRFKCRTACLGHSTYSQCSFVKHSVYVLIPFSISLLEASGDSLLILLCSSKT